jgi:hypothetical protein
VVVLLLEFALAGESQYKSNIRRNSGLWAALGLNPNGLSGLTPEGVAEIMLRRFMRIFGLDGGPPEEKTQSNLLRWVIKSHLPRDTEPGTSPEAITKAVKAGLIYQGHEVKDDETGELVETEVEDPGAERFVMEVERRDELDRLVARVRLSPGERLVLQGMRLGLKGEDLAAWVVEQRQGLRRVSVPVLASKLMSKLKKAAAH